jgi:hypothetical protein
MHDHYTWYATTVAQERGATILGILGVTGLVITAVELRRRLVTSLLAAAPARPCRPEGWSGSRVLSLGSAATAPSH